MNLMKLKYIFTILLLSLFFSWGSTLLAKINPLYVEQIKKDGWELLEQRLEQRNELYIFRKLTKEGPMAFRSVGMIKAPIMKVMILLRDVEGASKWTPNLLEKKMIHEYSYTDAITYNLNQIRWPAQNRDTVMRSTLSVDETNRWLVVKSHSVDHLSYPPRKGIVRAIVHSSNFIFKPYGNETFVDVDAHVDPKGMIPKWLANLVQKEWPSSFMKTLEENANKTKLPDNEIFKTMIEQVIELEKKQEELIKSGQAKADLNKPII